MLDILPGTETTMSTPEEQKIAAAGKETAVLERYGELSVVMGPSNDRSLQKNGQSGVAQCQ
jgi:hypothetical protein